MNGLSGSSATAQWVNTPSSSSSGRRSISRATASASSGATPTRFIPVSTLRWTRATLPWSRAATASSSAAIDEWMVTRRS